MLLIDLLYLYRISYFKQMKKIIAIFLIALYNMMLIVSYVPYMIYFGQQFMANDEDIVVFTDSDSKTLIGDVCYLNALIKRSVDTHNEKKAPPPPPIDISENIYIYSKTLLANNFDNSEDFNFKDYMISIKETFFETDIPPPKKLS